MEVKTFKSGGAHIPHYKSYTENKPITRMAAPDEVIIPLSQHLGAPCEPLVKVGDKVEVGQKIGDSNEFISAPVHASISGTVTAIEPRPAYTGGEIMSVIIKSDGGPQEFVAKEKRDPEKMSVEELRQAIREAGIVGMGGAAFPTHANISVKKPVEYLVLNGAECEPFLTCDHRQMVERPYELVEGAKILMRCIDSHKCRIGIEENKPDAIEAVSEKARDAAGIEVVPLAVKYPQGNKDQLIEAAAGKFSVRGIRSSDVGCIIRNVGTTIACYDAVVSGKPSMERVVTITGPTVPKSGNYIIKIGTRIGHVLKECGVESLDGYKVVLGGPMTGMALTDLEAGVVKGVTGILVLPPDMLQEEVAYSDCVRCGKCVDHCPMLLYPNELSKYAEAEMYDALMEWNIMDCMECGICSYICPAQRPIVHLIRMAKPTIRKMQRAAAGK